jgi:hypothetical protein
VYSHGTRIDILHAFLHARIPKTTQDRAPFPQNQTRVFAGFLESPTIHLTVSELHADFTLVIRHRSQFPLRALCGEVTHRLPKRLYTQ